MLDHMILTVSNVERSLAFYEAALKPLNIKFFLPYKGEGDHPDLWGFGDGKRAFFWIKQGKLDPASIHWGFMAENNGEVLTLRDEFGYALGIGFFEIGQSLKISSLSSCSGLGFHKPGTFTNLSFPQFHALSSARTAPTLSHGHRKYRLVRSESVQRASNLTCRCSNEKRARLWSHSCKDVAHEFNRSVQLDRAVVGRHARQPAPKFRNVES